MKPVRQQTNKQSEDERALPTSSLWALRAKTTCCFCCECLIDWEKDRLCLAQTKSLAIILLAKRFYINITVYSEHKINYPANRAITWMWKERIILNSEFSVNIDWIIIIYGKPQNKAEQKWKHLIMLSGDDKTLSVCFCAKDRNSFVLSRA